MLYYRNIYKGVVVIYIMEVKCQRCKYTWDTQSKLDLVTCPNCGFKTKKRKENERKGNSKV